MSIQAAIAGRECEAPAAQMYRTKQREWLAVTNASAVLNVMGRLGARALRVRAVVRFPIAVYRAHLGYLFGSRLLLLEHRGRRSGFRRYVVLEVVDHPTADRYVVASGLGETSQWLRNVVVDPRVRVSVGRRRLVPASATRLSPSDSATALASYARRHRFAWAMLKPVFEEALAAPVSELPLVALDLA